jgi:peptide/nickel transport system permease protein
MAAIAEDLALVRTPVAPRFAGATWRFMRRKPVPAAAALVLVVICGLALAAPLVAPYAPTAIALGARLGHPSSAHLFGTDEYGRDVFSRVLYGARVSLAAGLGAMALGTAVGTVLGLVSGYLGGGADLVIQRLMDAIMALPPIILLMVLATTLSPSLPNMIFAISVYVTPGAARIVRSAVLREKAMTYVEAAHAIGASTPRILFRQILPNVLAPIIVIASITVGGVIIIEAALGFLGLSVPPPTATWGNMLNAGAQSYMEQAPWLALAPGIAIAVTVISLNLFGDGLRDVLDPRLRGKGR